MELFWITLDKAPKGDMPMRFPLFVSTLLLSFALLQAQTITQEAENATLVSVTKATSHTGYSGTGYVDMAATGSITFTVNVAAKGFYSLVIRASTPMGNKNQKLYFNGAFVSSLAFGSNSAWFDFNAGNLAMLAGNNTIQIQPDWGYMSFDKITLTAVPAHDYSQVVAAPVDPLANTATKAVYTYMRSQFGKNIISGQTAYWTELVALAAKTPVQRAFDMQNYSPHNPWHTDWSAWDDGSVQGAIDWYNSTGKKGIVSFQWHWQSPTEGSLSTSNFYTANTTFDVSKAVQTGTVENIATLRDIDAIAVQLKRLQTAGVPVLWRPLHEAGGAWFWWGAKGAAPCLALYNIMYDRLTNYHGLHNLIWVWSTPEASWYPGNSKVDIIGYDSYPGAYEYGTQKSMFDQLFTLVQGKKMVAMTENGPIPDIDACIADDAPWAYFSSWVDLVASQNSTAHIQSVFAHSKVITLDEVNMSVPVSSSSVAVSSSSRASSSSVAVSSSSRASSSSVAVSSSSRTLSSSVAVSSSSRASSSSVAVSSSSRASSSSVVVSSSSTGPTVLHGPSAFAGQVRSWISRFDLLGRLR